MAFSTVIRRASSSLKPLTTLTLGAQRSHISSLINPLKKPISYHLSQRPFLHSRHHFSALAAKKPTSDHSLVTVINSEIICAEESDDHNRVDATPEGFPFEIEDNLGQQTILLRREYQGEKIRVEVHMPDLVTGEEEDDDDEDDAEKSTQSSIPLVVTVLKDSGVSLVFDVTAYPDEVAIDSFSVKKADTSEDQIPYEGPDFSSLDENLQKAFHKYLEIRGIKPSTTNFLHEYMINKDSREYLVWLKNLKKFIEK